MKKKTLLFVLTLLSTLTANAYVQIDGIYYDLNTSTKQATVTRESWSDSYTGDVTIPATVTYNDVTYSVTSIGNYAFEYCSGLTSVTIPNSVTSIGNYAFEYCSGLTSVEIPNSVTSIGESAFSDCSGLTSVEIPNSVTSIGNEAFEYCRSLTSVTIPNSVTTIGDRAFCDCRRLASITIPSSVTSIGRDAFESTEWYENQPDGMLYIGNVAYEYKGRMPENTSITLKDGTLCIADYAFQSCYSLIEVIIPNSVTSIGVYAFGYCSGLTEVTIPNSVTTIGNWAFSDCSGLTSVTIPNSVTSIGSSAYSDCYIDRDKFVNNSSLDAEANNYWGLSLIDSHEDGFLISNGVLIKYDGSERNVTIPSSVTSIGNEAFERNSSLKSVIIPNSVTSIGYRAFEDCYGLISITIGSGVTSIGSSAFEECSKLTDVYCHAEQVPNADYDTFRDALISAATLHVPEASIDAYKAKSPWREFGTIDAQTKPVLRGDANLDGEVGMPDVMFIIQYILNGKFPDE